MRQIVKMSSAVLLQYCVSLLVHPSRAQTSEILRKTLGIQDLEHSEGRGRLCFIQVRSVLRPSYDKVWYV